MLITSDTGNPFDVSVELDRRGGCVGEAGEDCKWDTVMSIRTWFKPSLFCNTSPCDSIRLIQTVKPMGIRNNQEVYVPFFELNGCDPDIPASRPWSWQQVDDAAVNGWSVDFNGDTFESVGGVVINREDGDCDPYYNGQDYWELHYGRAKGAFLVGAMGGNPSNSRITDAPGGGGSDSTYERIGITAKVMYFEVNAFCSDGVNQGEWIGRLTWRWECRPNLTPTITVLSVEPKAKPTAEFKAALLEFCHDRSFEFPDVEVPLEGGTACQGEFCFGGAPLLSRSAGRSGVPGRQP